MIKLKSCNFIGILNRLPTIKLEDKIKEIINCDYLHSCLQLLPVLMDRCKHGFKLIEFDSCESMGDNEVLDYEIMQMIEDIIHPGHEFQVPMRYGTVLYTGRYENVYPSYATIRVSDVGIIEYIADGDGCYVVPLNEKGNVDLKEHFIPKFLYAGEYQGREIDKNIYIDDEANEIEEYNELMEKRKHDDKILDIELHEN